MKSADARERALAACNCRLARKLWGNHLSNLHVQSLKQLTSSFRLSVLQGDLFLLQGKWYVTHTGLLQVASRNHCAGIRVELLDRYCDPNTGRWSFRATVFKARGCKGFVGYGDAEPSNVSPLVRGAEMRVAETRAVNRALGKAYGIGICSVEEMGSFTEPAEPRHELTKLPPESVAGNSGNGGGPRVRDLLCQIIRQHQLDAVLVKAYAVDFCGTKTLRDASREQVENFVSHLADCAKKDRSALLCQLNSYLKAKEGAA